MYKNIEADILLELYLHVGGRGWRTGGFDRFLRRIGGLDDFSVGLADLTFQFGFGFSRVFFVGLADLTIYILYLNLLLLLEKMQTRPVMMNDGELVGW